MRTKLENKYFENKDICATCKGECCKQLPGANFPEDFDMENTTENLVNALISGKYAIDSWEGDPGDGINKIAYYVRPATKAALGTIYDYSWGGECVFLTDTGCELEAKDRPLGCKALEPKKYKEDICIEHNNADKRNSALAWRKYFHTLDSFH